MEVRKLPAYSPDMNLDEGVWSYIKTRMLPNLSIRSACELREKVKLALHRLQKRKDLIISFLLHSKLTWEEELREMLYFTYKAQYMGVKNKNEMRKMSEKEILPQYADVCIVGLGPAGLGAALTLLKANINSKIICIDAGRNINNRICNFLEYGSCDRIQPCSVISGIGGTSFIGGHKYSSFPAGSSFTKILGSESEAKKKMDEALRILSDYIPLTSPNVYLDELDDIKNEFKENGFELKYYDSFSSSKNEMQKGYNKIIKEMIKSKIFVYPNYELVDMNFENNNYSLTLKRDHEIKNVQSKYVILGIGRYGESIINDLEKKGEIKCYDNHLEVGIRLEFPSSIFPDIDKFHNDLKLIYGDLRSYCVCKDGIIAPYFKNNVTFLDGYGGNDTIKGFTNFGINLRLPISRNNKKYSEIIIQNLQDKYNGMPIIQPLNNYLENNIDNNIVITNYHTTLPNSVIGNINDVYPDSISIKLRMGVERFIKELIPKDNWGKIMVLAPVLEYSWPRINVNKNFQVKDRLFFIGDCTGQFRGTVQAFCSGLICGESIIENITRK